MIRWVLGVRRYVIAALLSLVFAALAQAEPIFDVKTLDISASLVEARATVVADQQAISVEPPTRGGAPKPFDLDAAGPGPQYYWSLYTLTNSGPTARDVMIVIRHSGFPGSGLFEPAHTGSLVIASVANTVERPPHQKLVAQRGPGEDVFPAHLEVGQTLTYAFEGIEPLPDAEIFSAQAYGQRQSEYTGLQGAIAGIAGLLTLGFIILAITRRAGIAYGFSVFALSAFLFILHELGFIHTLLGSRFPYGIGQDTLRAIVESVLCFGFIAGLAAIRGVTRQQKALFYSFAGSFVLPVLNLGVAFVAAPQATAIARIGIVFFALEGLILLYRAQRTGKLVALNAMPTWLIITAWTAFATFACFAKFALPQLSMFLLLGLCAVLAAMGYVLLQNLFERVDYETEVAAQSTERSSLALSSADHYVWEWRPQHERITADPELFRSLGYRGPDLEDTSQLRFFERIHPEDLQDLLEKSGAVAAGASRLLESELRLNSADGSFRWFSLKARAHVDELAGELVCLGTLTEITKAKVIEHRLLEDAVHDPVSGLPSRALFLDRLQRALASRTADPVRVLIVDLDRFKVFNDGYGPDIGDHLLMIMARRIQDQLGPEDSATRLTGSQFAIAFNELNHGQDDAFARTVMLALSAPIMLTNREVVITISAGLSMRGLPGIPADELMAQATNALLSAKQQGLGSLVIYDYGMRNERVAQVALESDLRLAITRGEIEVHYQPIVSLINNKTAGFEALARWRHPKLGIVAPDQFINAAEEAGLISEIGTIVLTEASRQLGIWQRTIARNKKIFVTVNASPSQLLEKDFVGAVQRVMERDILLPGTLKIEVTEAVIMRYSDRIVSIFGALRQLGIGLACDDFGTGFSSLSTLRNLPFDTLKLDRSFISSGQDDDRAAHVIRTVLDLAHGLGMAVVCEGIESLEQAERLSEMGCDYGQGFHFGAAAPARLVEDLIAIAPLQAAGPAPPPRLVDEDGDEIVTSPAKPVEPDELPSIFSVSTAEVKPLPPAAGPVLTLTPQRKRRAVKKKPPNRTRGKR